MLQYVNTYFTAKFPRGNPTPQTPQAASIISVRFTACPAETPTPYAPSRGRGEKTWSKLLVGESFSKGTTKMCLYPFNWERNVYHILYLHLVYTVYFHIHFDWKYASTQTMHRQGDGVQLWHWQMPQWSLSCRQSPIRTDLKDTINEKIRITAH